MNKTSFNERDIIKNLAVLGIDLDRYNKIRNSNKYRDIKYQSLEDWEATGKPLGIPCTTRRYFRTRKRSDVNSIVFRSKTRRSITFIKIRFWTPGAYVKPRTSS